MTRLHARFCLMLCAALLSVALLLNACAAASINNSSQTPTPTTQPATTSQSSGPPTITPPPAASSCSEVSGVAGGGATINTPFADVSLPTSSVAAVLQTTEEHSYLFQLIAVCTPNSTASNVTTALGNNMLNNGWVQSATYPYHGNAAGSCADVNCWHKDFRYVALEGTSTAGQVTVYALRLAIVPYQQNQSVNTGGMVQFEPEAGNDLLWSNNQLAPANSAATLVNIGSSTNLDAVTLNQLQNLHYRMAPLGAGTGQALAAGDVFAVHDFSGHYCKVQVIAVGSTLQLQWDVYRLTF